MGFDLIYRTHMGSSCILVGSNMEKNVKTVFPGGYGWIGDIQHGPIRPDWGL